MADGDAWAVPPEQNNVSRRGALSIGVLGPLEVRRAGRPVSLPGNRLRSILAVLAHSAGRPVSVDAIGEHIWGGDQPDNPRRSVQTWIARLRGELGADLVLSRANGYLLNVAPENVDALRFAALLDHAQGVSDPGDERAALHEALALWRGTPFEGVRSALFEEVERPQLTERYLTALERTADLDIAADDPRACLGRLQTETARHPLRESLWARLLNVLASTGRPAEALSMYESIRMRLVAELGVDPGPELRRVHAMLLAADDPDRAAPTQRPWQLPADLEHFVGRADVLAVLDEEMLGEASSAGAIVALEGNGGVGKTSLTVRWAHRRRESFPDGQLFVDLRGYSTDPPVEPAAALGSMLTGLGVAGDRIPAELDARSALLRTLLADRRTLVVLDNALDAEQVRPLLPGTSGRVIVTSRRDLRGLAAREGARRVSLTEFTSTDAVALITARLAGRVDAGPDELAELARLCGQWPLALVIVAEHVARHSHVPVAELVAGLRDERGRLDALDDDDPAASVRSVFSWSYATLDDDSALALRLLATFLPFDFSNRAAAAVVGLGLRETRQVLDRLVGTHLLQRSGPGRFEFHDLVRLYAAGRCEIEDDVSVRDTAERRYLDWLLFSLRNAVSVMKPIHHRAFEVFLRDPTAEADTFEEFSAALTWCHRERRTLVYAVQWAHAYGYHHHSWRLAWQLGNYLLMSEYNDELLLVSEVGVDAAKHVGEQAMYLALNSYGNALSRAWQEGEALRRLDEALALCRSHGDIGAESVLLMNRATSLTHERDLEGAVAGYRASMAAAEAWRRDGAETSLLSPNMPAILLNLGNALNELGRYDEGIARTEEALAVAREAGNQIIVGLALGNLGEALEATGAHERAHACCVEAEALLREIDARQGLVDVLLTHARIYAATGRSAEVRTAVDEALEVLGDLDDPRILELNAIAETTIA